MNGNKKLFGCFLFVHDLIYNIIREIEYSFRTLKTDLDLRPIYHRKDPSTMAHLHGKKLSVS